MPAQRLNFLHDPAPKEDQGVVFYSSGSDIVTALICDNVVLRTRLEQILAGTHFIVAETSVTAGSSRFYHPAPEPALYIIGLGQNLHRPLETVSKAKQRSPGIRSVVVADQFDLNFVWRAREAGVDGFCLKSSSRAVLVKSLELIMLGEGVLPSSLVRSVLCGRTTEPEAQSQVITVTEAVVADPRMGKLSAREREILVYLMDGASNKQIARNLDIAEATVKVHVNAVLRKIGMRNRTQAAMWATARLPAQQRMSRHA